MAASTTLKIPAEVQAIINECTVDSAAFVLRLPPRQLERKLYEGVKKVMDAAGGKWKGGKVEGFVFPCLMDLLNVRSAAEGKGEIVREQVVKQAYYTPDMVADAVAREAFDHVPAETRPLFMLEPSCGRGALICAAQAVFFDRDLRVLGIDSDPAALDFCNKALSDMGNRFSSFEADFLECELTQKYDLILMNPPYTKGAVDKHVAHARKFLAPRGVLISIVPANFTAPDIFAEHSLPAKSFKESGTNVDTKYVVIRHP
jgi:predicted RNA methylase